jgi:thiol-disulfide isomerase/thioredoxin
MTAYQNDDQPDVSQPSREPAPPADATPPDEPQRSRKRWIAVALAGLALALFAVPLLRGPVTSHQAAGPVAGEDGLCATSRGVANLDFTLTSMSGEEVRLSDYRGKVILLNFWATWCGPCKYEIPDFVEVYDAYRDQGLEILGVLNLDDPSDEELRAFADEYGMNYPVFRASDEFEAANGPIWGLPTTFLIDRAGTICSKHMGPVSKETVEREIKGLL